MKEVVRSYILPKRGPEYIERIPAMEGRAMLQKYVDMLRHVIEGYVKSEGKIANASELNEVLNEIVVVIKWNLYLDPVPDIIPSPAFLIRYLIRYKKLLKPYEVETLRALHQNKDVLKFILNEIKEYSKFRDILFDILRYPADTRPAANSSSLIIHMLTTSAVASSLFISNYGLDERKLANLRLLCLFHDIGKFMMEEWERHEKNSAKYLRELFGPYVKGEAWAIVEEVAKALESGEGHEEIFEIFRRADRIASRIDRVPDYFIKAISPDSRQAFLRYVERYNERFGKRDYFNDWRFWESMTIDEIAKFSEDFAKNVSCVRPTNPLLEERYEGAEVEAMVVRFDMWGIQRYIRVNDLRSMCGASKIIDYICFTALPAMLINEVKLPAECILYFGGGNVTTLVPNGEVLSEIDEECSKLEREFGITIIHGESKLYDTLSAINYRIDSSLSKKKVLEVGSGPVSPNISYICDYCFEEPASEIKEEHFICKSCKTKYDVGNLTHFKYRVDRLNEILGFKLDWDEALAKRILEYLAGIDYEKLEEIKKYPNLALVRFDANLASQIMASCISITDAVERSIRLDYSIKKALHEFLAYLKDKYPHDYCRLALGVMYVGGDDGFIILPSYLAILLGLHLTREFYLNMGCKATLSVGIAVAKPKHPLLQLYEAAGHMLDEYSKEAARGEVLKIHEDAAKLSWGFCGSLSFYVADTGAMSNLALDSVTKVLTGKGLSIMGKLKGGKSGSYYVSDFKDAKSIFRPLSLVSDGINIDKFDFRGLIDEVKRDNKDKLRELRNVAMDIMFSSLFGDDGLYVKVIYSMRQGERVKGMYKELVKRLLNFRGNSFPLHDFIQILKILEGGFEL